ncbi:MAG TPA: sodium:solute symporter, partial [Gammaproteobacteria bacterium]|nr:sodium:solute symporter [Gammaproteobacteria bacterium]
SSQKVIKRNMALLPAYSLVLGLIAALGYMAFAAGVQNMPEYSQYFARYGANFAVPALFLHEFPAWFSGFGFAAIAIGALVPAAIMSIAAANLFTRNIYREFFRPACSDKEESSTAKLISLVVKVGALAFILFLPTEYAIQFQLLGGIWIIQTLPAIVLGLYTRWLHPWALLAGWLVGMSSGTLMAAAGDFSSSTYALQLGDFTVSGYAALYSLVINLVVCAVLTLTLKWMRIAQRPAAADEDY